MPESENTMTSIDQGEFPNTGISPSQVVNVKKARGLFLKGISREAYITIQRTELNSPIGLQVQLHIFKCVPALSICLELTGGAIEDGSLPFGID
ncbi:hypothetical protein K1719_031717 [Acacia pycnantha]|nr:hypothetical protein K1719_031717 [Acacia pycnantha]